MKLNLLFVITVLCSIDLFNHAAANDIYLEDAEHFVSLLSITSKPNEKQIEQKYLALGTKGIDIFTPYRIKNAKNLALAISKNPKAYQKGIDICFPAAQNIANETQQLLKKTQVLLKQTKSAPTYILFGANNSGGTASTEGLAISLEVMCRFANTQTQAKEVILGMIAHEIVHVYQFRAFNEQVGEITLLHQALIEGVADFIANLILGKITNSENDRHYYGLKNEALIWAEFKAVMLGHEFKPWMYGSGKDDRPNDLGYWLGKRIAKAYYEKSDNKNQALQTLLYLDDPESILLTSGYDPK
ncbi:MAG: hypothetical protein HRU24_01465 [Gammaproteobacteria bacterium]|nr:hypothetical protein [Gammaproteobacteria bacterium]